MDGERFDSLTRTLATYVGRRVVAAALAGGALGALLGGHAPEAPARKRKRRKKKQAPCARTCAGKGCGDPDGCGGTCTDCPSGQTCIGSQCVTDVCDPPCRFAHFCQNGECVCPLGLRSCDINFCGTCCNDRDCDLRPFPPHFLCRIVDLDNNITGCECFAGPGENCEQ